MTDFLLLLSACNPCCFHAKFVGSVANELHACYANHLNLHENMFWFSLLSHQHRHLIPVDAKWSLIQHHVTPLSCEGRSCGSVMKCFGISLLLDNVYFPFPNVWQQHAKSRHTFIFLTELSTNQLFKQSQYSVDAQI